MASSFIPWAQCAICFRSLPLTRGVLLLLCSLSLSLSLSCFLVSVWASIFLFLSSQPVWRQEVGAKVVCHFGRLLLILCHPFPSSTPFLLGSIRSFPHASCQRRWNRLVRDRSFFFLLQFFYLPASSSRRCTANDGLIIQKSSLSICLTTKEYLIFFRPLPSVWFGLFSLFLVRYSSSCRKRPKSWVGPSFDWNPLWITFFARHKYIATLLLS